MADLTYSGVTISLAPRDEPTITDAGPVHERGSRIDTLAIGMGGGGKAVLSVLNAFAVRDGRHIPMLALDNDYSLPDPILLPGGEIVKFPSSALVTIGSTNEPRGVVKNDPVLSKRYVDGPNLLRGISVYDTYAGGGGVGYPVVTALDMDLSIGKIRQALVEFLARWAPQRRNQAPSEPDETGFEALQRRRLSTDVQTVPPVLRIIIIGSGCGSNGAAGHILLPYLVRQATARIGLPDPYRMGILLGPEAYAGLHPRTATNWLATVEQLDHLTRHGLTWEFFDGSEIDAAVPPYNRIVLADRPCVGEKATEGELMKFYAQIAKSLYVAMTSNVFERLETVDGNTTHQPWMTLQGALAQIDRNVVAKLATNERVLAGLRAFSAA